MILGSLRGGLSGPMEKAADLKTEVLATGGRESGGDETCGGANLFEAGESGGFCCYGRNGCVNSALSAIARGLLQSLAISR